MEGQKTTSEERYEFLVRHLDSWFFTRTAMELAENELKVRTLEMGNVKLS